MGCLLCRRFVQLGIVGVESKLWIVLVDDVTWSFAEKSKWVSLADAQQELQIGSERSIVDWNHK